MKLASIHQHLSLARRASLVAAAAAAGTAAVAYGGPSDESMGSVYARQFKVTGSHAGYMFTTVELSGRSPLCLWRSTVWRRSCLDESWGPVGGHDRHFGKGQPGWDGDCRAAAVICGLLRNHEEICSPPCRSATPVWLGAIHLPPDGAAEQRPGILESGPIGSASAWFCMI